MAALSAAQLVDLSERGRAGGTASRAAMLIAAAHPELSPERIRALRLSDCDRMLAAIRSATFGPRLDAQQACSACAEPFEIALDLAALFCARASTDLLAERPASPGSMRPLNLGDLAAVERERDPARIAARLAERVVARDEAGQALDLAAISAALEQADPDADVSIETTCPACGVEQQLSIDVGAYLWEEIAIRAPRILRDVAELAQIYHWSERDILAMSGQRRAFYLSVAR